MKTDEIKLMYEYNYWANHRILATAAKITPEQYAAQTAFGNLRSTMIHLLDAEVSWRLTFQQCFSPVAKPNEPAEAWDYKDLTEADLPTLADLAARWHTEETEMRAYLHSLSDEDLNGFVRYAIPGGIVRERVLWHCMLHLVNHGTQHRAESAALLTSFNQSPGDLDMTVFLNGYFNLPSPA